MWRNYLIVGVRALLKSKTFAFINIAGMAMALAPCLIILLYLRYELSYDRWIPNADRIFQLQTFRPASNLGGPLNTQVSSTSARAALSKDFPEIESSVQLMSWMPVIIQNGEASIADHFLVADGNIFEVLDLPLVAGDPKHALDRPGNLVLTEQEARRRFPHQDALGRTLTLIMENEPADYRVTGIVRDFPKNSHLRLGMVMRYDRSILPGLTEQFFTDWGWWAGPAYVKLRPGVDVANINARLPAWKIRNIPPPDPSDPYNDHRKMSWKLVNIRDIHVGQAQDGLVDGNSQGNIATFGMIALLILGMAVVNFVNLATARGSERAREAALRKVVGANRGQLIVQFLGESILLTGIAMMLGLAIAELLLPHVNAFLDIDMSIHYFGREGVLLPILALILAVGATGGLYPALYLSRFQPARILKANKSAAEPEGSSRLRGVLVVGQFAISIGLVICTMVVHAQTVHARTAEEGYRREGLIQISNIGLMQVGNVNKNVTNSQRETLRREIGMIAGVRQAALTAHGVNAGAPYLLLKFPGYPTFIGMISVGANYFDTMGMTLLAGRQFDETVAMDNFTALPGADPKARHASYGRANVIVTALTARILGFANPQAAIGKEVQENGKHYTIVGVVQDARLGSVRTKIGPAFYYLGTDNLNIMMVRFDTRDPGRVMAEIEKRFRQVMPTLPFQGEYVEDRLRDMYRPEEARGRLFGAFALVAVLIGCLGLFGLAAFTAERRTKEIGIRKVLGATTKDIVRLLAWQFTKPVIIANIIAWPVAWWLMRDWLNGFDARIALRPVYFLAAGAVALVIALGTIAGHALKVARAKPIRALRYE